jgi:tRNA-modifying protein YgfZ
MKLALDQPMIIEVAGNDATKILHNLTTNHIQILAVGQAIETFVTDVRGWVVAHGLVFHIEPARWLLVGQHPNPAAVAAHIDRYIIREQATVCDRSPQFQLVLNLNSEMAEATAVTARPTDSSNVIQIAAREFGATATLELYPASDSPAKLTDDQNSNLTGWLQLRIAHFWPLMAIDIWEKCIPQELDRTEQAISFTKGCYLGQETIARLDARGQIQKKLCLLKVDGLVQPNQKLLFNDQEVGHVTSAVAAKDCGLALAVLRRGYFELDTRLTCDGQPTQVIDSACALRLLPGERS